MEIFEDNKVHQNLLHKHICDYLKHHQLHKDKDLFVKEENLDLVQNNQQYQYHRLYQNHHYQ